MRKAREWETYAAVEAICPNRPGLWPCADCVRAGGWAVVLAPRLGCCCCGVTWRFWVVVGREGAARAGAARPRLRGMFTESLQKGWIIGRRCGRVL